MTNETLLSADQADDALFRALTLFIGRGRRHGVEDVCAGTSIPSSTIGKWLTPDPLQRRRPKAADLSRVAQFLGLDFLNKWWGPFGFGARPLEPEEGSPGVVMAHLTKDIAKIANCGATGAWNHTHHRDLEHAADDMIQILTPLSSLGHPK